MPEIREEVHKLRKQVSTLAEFGKPEVVDAMARALAAACKALGVGDENVMVRLLAERIIEEAKQGIHGFELLKAAALRGLTPARKH